MIVPRSFGPTLSRNLYSQHFLCALAEERRTVVADWRILVLAMRFAVSERLPLPTSAHARRQILGMLDRQELRPLPECNGVYRVSVPFASLLPCPDEFIVQECCPPSFLAYSNALFYHGLTFEIPASLSFVIASDSSLIPIGTSADDWTDIPRPRQRKPATIHDRNIHWHQLRGGDMPGVGIGYVEGLPIYVTDLERTLIDALRFPESCGGVAMVFEAWRRATDRLDIKRLVEYAQVFEKKLMFQRIGFILEELGLSHPALNEWAINPSRGSSARLVASREFSSTYSERWCLSINVSPNIESRHSIATTMIRRQRLADKHPHDYRRRIDTLSKRMLYRLTSLMDSHSRKSAVEKQ